jgi:hypothetical protein
VQEEASLDDEQIEGMMAQLVLAKQAIFDKPAKNRHMRPLYLRGYVNGKPLTKMFVDGGAAVNVKPRIFLEKPESLYHRDSPWISGYRVQNVSQIDTQSHTSHHIKLIVH